MFMTVGMTMRMIVSILMRDFGMGLCVGVWTGAVGLAHVPSLAGGLIHCQPKRLA